MKGLLFILSVTLMLCATNAVAKGHGGGGHGGGHSGGHGGGHAGSHMGGGGHSVARGGGSRMAAGRSGARTTSTAGRTTGSGARNSVLGPLPRNTRINTIGRSNGALPYRNNVVTNNSNTYHNQNEHWNSYPYYYYGSYGYAPYYDPYFSMWSFGANFMYTPHYGYGGGYGAGNSGYGNSADNSNGLYDNNEPMLGYVVYEHDTINGDITMSKNAVQIETADTATSYDYKFKLKQPGLQYVSVYDNNDTTNQLNLVRLSGDKKLLRQVHTGKLNIYDGHHGFINRPEDIDVSSIVVVYNGQQDAIHSSSINRTKEWLTGYVNKAYGLSLKPQDFSWKELLIYVDKLD